MTTFQEWAKEPIPRSVLTEINETPGWLSLEEAALLYQLSRQTTEGSILEVGSYRGRSTIALAKGALAGGLRAGSPLQTASQRRPAVVWRMQGGRGTTAVGLASRF